MMFDWDAFVTRLRSYSPGWHRLLSPCPADRIEYIEKELGKLPLTLAGMLKRFNGAELFISGSPLVSFFRISSVPPLPPLEWAPEWCIDSFTAEWRKSGSDRQGHWAIAMTGYGGLVLLDGDGTVNEWDTAENKWSSQRVPLEDWIETVLAEGDVVIAEQQEAR